MEQDGLPLGVAARGVFKHHREYPRLPEGYTWETQRQRYCPRDLHIKSLSGQSELKHKFGYVFCHRGLYERALGILDNSAGAIENGINQGFFLHEVDAFLLEKLDKAFVAHDKSPQRVTSKKEVWDSYSFHEIITTPLVTRRVNMATPDFASSYLQTDEKVLGLINTLWEEKLRPVGRTLQIDLRDEDFARGIPYYSFHIAKVPFQFAQSQGAHKTLVWSMFQSTILKGYNEKFVSFDHLHDEIRRNSRETYGRNYFDLRHLHMLPPLIMVFYADPLIKLAGKTKPKERHGNDRKSYEHLYDIFLEQVKSFIRIGPNSYNFILEIVHSGLGLGYDRTKPLDATNPLDGEPLIKPEVVFESRVDRVMIDVSLALRKEYPDLLFSSCTRLPDVITSTGKYKAKFQTSRLVPLQEGEEGLATKIRAMHGGLYPQSHLVVADDPMAEIAARTWIDEESGLDRSDLLTIPYYKWLAKAKRKDIVAAMEKLTKHDFLPNRVEDAVPEAEPEPHNPRNLNAKIGAWLEGVLFPHDGGADRRRGGYESDRDFPTREHSSPRAATTKIMYLSLWQVEDLPFSAKTKHNVRRPV
ncbi:hypothetical protein N7522_000444 [Penicillium canescens]|nr:hypothetical protein N7522_000444 [Penicillium canescens]